MAFAAGRRLLKTGVPAHELEAVGGTGAADFAALPPLVPVRPPLTQRIGGLDIVAATMGQATRLLCHLAVDSGTLGRHVHLVNAFTMAEANRSPALRSILTRDALNLPDGRPLAMMGRYLFGNRHMHQIRGPNVFRGTFDRGRALGIRHYLLGSTPEVLRKLRHALEAAYPGVLIVGADSPPFRPLTPAERVAQDQRISDSGADIVWVGLGTPKQDFEVHRLASSLPVLAVGVGAAFDFTAGTKPEAPGFLRFLGLEWAFRLAREPHRLWRRYLLGNLLFLRMVLVPPRASGTTSSGAVDEQ